MTITFTLLGADQSSLSLQGSAQAVMGLRSASQASMFVRETEVLDVAVEWIADNAVLFFDAEFPNGF